LSIRFIVPKLTLNRNRLDCLIHEGREEVLSGGYYTRKNFSSCIKPLNVRKYNEEVGVGWVRREMELDIEGKL
jgi:hypothetical protein